MGCTAIKQGAVEAALCSTSGWGCANKNVCSRPVQALHERRPLCLLMLLHACASPSMKLAGSVPVQPDTLLHACMHACIQFQPAEGKPPEQQQLPANCPQASNLKTATLGRNITVAKLRAHTQRAPPLLSCDTPTATTGCHLGARAHKHTGMLTGPQTGYGTSVSSTRLAGGWAHIHAVLLTHSQRWKPCCMARWVQPARWSKQSLPTHPAQLWVQPQQQLTHTS